MSFPLLGSNSESEHAFDSQALIIHQQMLGPTLTCVVSGALMELTPLSHVLLWLCGVVLFLWLSRVVFSRHALALSFVLWFGSTFPLLLMRRSKVSLLLFEFLLNLGSIPVCRTKRGDVKELHFLLNVFVQTAAIL